MANLVGQVDYFSMVPDEILVHIFRNLPLEDRKNIRSTCCRFYNLCDNSRLQTDEVVALSGIINTDSVFHCLSRTSRKIHNIKLSYVHLQTEVILPFFEQQGSYVQSLVFENCLFDPRALKVIVERCPSLHHFALDFGLSNGYENVLKDFEDLETNSIVRDSVTDFSLILSTTSNHLSNRKFLHFFGVFPKIKKLSLNIHVDSWSRYSFNQCSTNPSDIWTDSSFTFSCIHNRLLALADQLEVLKLEFDCMLFDSCTVPYDIFHIHMKNLKELSVNWVDFQPDVASLQLSLLFERLTHFSCSIHFGYREPESLSLYILHLLRSTPLKSLTLTGCTVSMDRELFQALVESKLISLEIEEISEISLIGDLMEPASRNTLIPNYCLQNLVVDEKDCNLTLLFATYFRGLKRLKFSEVHQGVLQNVCKCQTRIQSLHLSNLSGDGHFKELSYFQDWLRKEATTNRELRYLTELKIVEDEYSLTDFLLSEFVFPELKSLSIAIGNLDKAEEQRLCGLLRKLWQLESLNLEFPLGSTFSQWSALVVGCSKLRHLLIISDTFSTPAEYSRLFEVLPSLSTVVHYCRPDDWCTYEAKYFFRDVINKKIVDVCTEKGFGLNNDFYSFISHLSAFRKDDNVFEEWYQPATPGLANRVLPFLGPHMPCLKHLVLDREGKNTVYVN